MLRPRGSVRTGRAPLRSEAEVGERVLALPVEDDPRHLAVADVEQARCVRPHLPEPRAAGLATRTDAVEHEDAFVVELAVLLHLGGDVLPAAQEVAPERRHLDQPRMVAGL